MNKHFDIGDFVNIETEQTITNNLVLRVKLRRKELKLSQKELGERSGVSYASIRRFESSGEISLSSLIKISKALNCLEDFNLLFKNKQITNLKDLHI